MNILDKFDCQKIDNGWLITYNSIGDKTKHFPSIEMLCEFIKKEWGKQ